jgi:transcriptional regulator with XRE-family HTH domain
MAMKAGPRKGRAAAEVSPRLAYEKELLRGEAVEMVAGLLKELGISQRNLAERLGVGEARVSRILSGRENATLATLATLGHALGLRFSLVAIPYADRAGTPAENDPLPPPWLEEERQRLAGTDQVAGP